MNAGKSKQTKAGELAAFPRIDTKGDVWAGGYFQEQETLVLDLTCDWDLVEAEDGARHSSRQNQEWEKLWIVWKTVKGPGPLEKKGLFGELWKDEDREGC